MEQGANSSCVSIVLHSAPAAINQIDLKISCRFNEQAIEIPDGCIWFGWKRVTLRLAIVEGKFCGRFYHEPARFELELESLQGQPREPEISLESTMSSITVLTDSQQLGTKCRLDCQPTGESELTWVFETIEEPALRGQLTEYPLGAITLTAPFYQLSASVEVEAQRDLAFTGAATRAVNLETKGLNRNRIALLDQSLLQRSRLLQFVASKMQPSFSHVEERYE
ncbi:hypothetical protein IFO70_17250 [Phormidium tenue FACHB-886]|nr:hypothetical protein [Phormidium tenue FACHB-886]